MKVMAQIDVSVDELFGNIANYAYGDETGYAEIRLEDTEEKPGIIIEFEDAGMPFNPLAKEDPDTSLSINERGIGGLGIFIVKKTMDDVYYRYENNCNILGIKKFY